MDNIQKPGQLSHVCQQLQVKKLRSKETNAKWFDDYIKLQVERLELSFKGSVILIV